MMRTTANPMMPPPNRVARIKRMSQRAASMPRLCASPYIQMAPAINATTPTAHRARRKSNQPARTTWNAVTIESSKSAASSAYFRVAGAVRPDSRGQGHLARRAVGARPADRGVADRVLEAAVFALDPDAHGKVVPVPRRLAAARAAFRVGRAQHGAPNGHRTFNLSEALPRARTQGRLRLEPRSPTLGLDLDRISDLSFPEGLDEIGDSREGLAAQARDHVPDLEACGLGR